MGCDIHAFIEVKKDGEWRHHDWKTEVIVRKHEDGSTKYDYDLLFKHPMYIERNYSLFGILANVRNGVGFAGIDTGNGFIPISQPRGLPADVTETIRQQSEEWGVDGHSHSYLTLRELQDYDWNRKTVHRGWVDVKGYLEHKKRGRPTCYSAGVFGGSIRKVTNREMEQVIENGTVNESYYTQIEWIETYANSAQRFVNMTIPSLATLGAPEDVRLVFWFDN